MGQAGSTECLRNLEIIQKICGLPLKVEKLEGPTTVLTFLGITMDTPQCTAAAGRSSVIPVGLLVLRQPNWTSVDWREIQHGTDDTKKLWKIC